MLEDHKTIRSYFCWLLGHNFLCLFRYHWGTEDRSTQGSETTYWVCQYCGKRNEEQWDT
jgi:hypothetical protein